MVAHKAIVVEIKTPLLSGEKARGYLRKHIIELLRKYSSHCIKSAPQSDLPLTRTVFACCGKAATKYFEYLQFPVDVLNDGSEFA